jgi:hypothetical protein
VNLLNGFINQDPGKTICPAVCGTFCPVPGIRIGQTLSAQLVILSVFFPEISQKVTVEPEQRVHDIQGKTGVDPFQFFLRRIECNHE